MQIVDLDTLAKRLGASRRSVTRWVSDGLPLAEPDGTRKRVDLEAAWAWCFARGHTKLQPPAATGAVAAAPQTPEPSDDLSPEDEAALAQLLDGAATSGKRVIELLERVPASRVRKLQELGKARKAAAEAHVAELKLAQQRGDVLSREEFARGDLARCALIKQTLLGLADRLAPKLVRQDEAEVRRVVGAEVRAALETLSKEWPGP